MFKFARKIMRGMIFRITIGIQGINISTVIVPRNFFALNFLFSLFSVSVLEFNASSSFFIAINCVINRTSRLAATFILPFTMPLDVNTMIIIRLKLDNMSCRIYLVALRLRIVISITFHCLQPSIFYILLSKLWNY